MAFRYIPIFLRHAPTPGVQGFAILAGIEASLRGMLVSVWPLVMYAALSENAGRVSLAYFTVGVASLLWGLMVPWISRFLPRRWVYTGGCVSYLVGATLAITVGGPMIPVAMALTSFATVTVFVCTNAYLMDFIARSELGRTESQKMFYSALSWVAGPILGVALWKIWAPLPFLIAIGFALLLLTTFWRMRLGNGRTITRARAPAPNPLAYLARFFRQPRLVAGWLFAVLRSSAWWVYVVYLPIFCIESGLGDRAASYAFSASNALLLLAPRMLRWMQPRGLRHGVRTAFIGASACFVFAALGHFWPPAAIIGLLASSLFLVMLDAFGGLPFLLAVRPAERTEMSAVYASYRDVSGILTPGVAWFVLLIAPLAGVFVACAGGLLAAAAIAGRLHPRLGERRVTSPEEAA
jgi:MFS transporter, ACDE family, multidrug resistance protein